MFETSEEQERFNEQRDFEKAMEHEDSASTEAKALNNQWIAEFYDINELVVIVQHLRKQVEFINSTVALAREKWAEINAGILQDQAQLKAKLFKEEQKLKERALEVFAQTKDKHPAIGVEIKIYTELKYDQKQALEWAKAHDLALVLDQAEFQKLAIIKKPDFVEMHEIPKAQISRNLEVLLQVKELQNPGGEGAKE